MLHGSSNATLFWDKCHGHYLIAKVLVRFRSSNLTKQKQNFNKNIYQKEGKEDDDDKKLKEMKSLPSLLISLAGTG